MQINNIFMSLEGEGVMIGIPQVFVRLQGCVRRCANCDTLSSWDPLQGSNLSISEIIKKVESFNIKRVSITGGDVGLQLKELTILITKLKEQNFFINLEVDGSAIYECFKLVDFISFDVKTPSTGTVLEESKVKDLILELTREHLGKFQIKSPVFDDDDFNYIKNLYTTLTNSNFPWVITPIYNINEEFPLSRIKNIFNKTKNFPYFRMIIQQHKIIFGGLELDI